MLKPSKKSGFVLVPLIILILVILGFGAVIYSNFILPKVNLENRSLAGERTRKFPDYQVIPIIFVPKDQKEPNFVQKFKIQSWITYLQGWFASRLDNKTFSQYPLTTYKGKQNNDWYLKCQSPYPLLPTGFTACNGQEVYHNVLKELSEAGYPAGAASKVKANLLVFFQGETGAYWALGGSEEENGNISFVALPKLTDLYSRNLSSLNIELNCPLAATDGKKDADCHLFDLLYSIAHEMSHTFGLSHIVSWNPSWKDPHQYGSSIINNGEFPHTGFYEGGPDERGKMLSSPFMNKVLMKIPEPLNRLAISRIKLSTGYNLISLPLNFPYVDPNAPQGTAFIYRVLALDNSCSKIEAISSIDENGNPIWQTYQCKPISQNDIKITPGKGFWIKVLKDTDLIVYGYLSKDTPAISLKKGWNLVGPSWINYKSSTADVLKSLNPSLELVYGYDPNNQSDPWKVFDPAAPPQFNSLASIETGRGYWIRVNNDRLWSIENSKNKTLLSPQQKGSSAIPQIPE